MSSLVKGEVNSLIVIWRIENFEDCIYRPICSPPFCILDENCDLWLVPESQYTKEPRLSFNFVLCNENIRDRSKHVPFDIELSLICEGDSFVCLDKVINVTGVNRLSTKHFEVRDGMIKWNEHLSLPMDTFTVLFRIWSFDVVLDAPAQLFVRTQLGILQAISYDWAIKNYGDNTKKRMKRLPLVSIPDEKSTKPYLTSVLSKRGVCKIDVHNLDTDRIFSGICKLRLLDAEGSMLPFTNEKEGNLFLGDSLTFHNKLPISEKDMKANKKIFLSKGILRIHCDIHLKGIRYNEIEEISCGSKTSDIGYIVGEVETKSLINSDTTPDSDRSCGTHHPYDVSELSRSNLSTKPIDWDFALRAGGETFPVHKAVLSARSPFFKTMFENGTMDTVSNIFELPDVDADTLYRILLFVYKDAVDNLKFESAKKLFAAARKYQFLILKQKCSLFLKSNLSVSDACDTLIMADENQESDLKAAVTDFIFEYDEIISSDEWSELKENHPKLAADTLQMILQKNKSWTARYTL